MEKKVFLGGTCNDSKWRDELIPLIEEHINYFNPVVDDWTEEMYQKELEEKRNSDYELYVITPKMTGVFSIAEVVDCSNKTPDRTIFCVLNSDEDYKFDKGQLKSLEKVGEMINNNGGKSFSSLEDIAEYFKNSNNIPATERWSDFLEI